MIDRDVQRVLQRGVVIPAHPLALDAQRRLDERRQRALSRYYLAAGAGGLAVGVHTTQFAIRDPEVGLLRPVLELAAGEMDRASQGRAEPLVRIAGVCGPTAQAVTEATLARELRYDAGLLSLGALRQANDDELLAHCRAVADVLPIVGFYLQPAVGGRVLPYTFWCRLMELPGVVAVKIAPFNRYQTLDVVRAVAESGRQDVALYTGNDDNILADLLTPYRVRVGDAAGTVPIFGPESEAMARKWDCPPFASPGPEQPWIERRIVGGLLGHWAVWTRRAVEHLEECHRLARCCGDVPADMLRLGVQITDCNAALFDAANAFAGCICGIHEVLRRQGLLAGTWCLDPREQLSPGQDREIDRVLAAYPHLADDEFVRQHREEWLSA